MQAAHAIARRIGDEFSVPVMLYGGAHPHGRRLAQLRRDAGYFRGEKGGAWAGVCACSSSCPLGGVCSYSRRAALPHTRSWQLQRRAFGSGFGCDERPT